MIALDVEYKAIKEQKASFAVIANGAWLMYAFREILKTGGARIFVAGNLISRLLTPRRR